MSVKAIETRYAGHLFRSRLEARWAAFFDEIGWKWTYEPADMGGWIPDFAIHGKSPLLVEVKPCGDLESLEKYQAKIDEANPNVDTILVGFDPVMGHDGCYGFDDQPAAGLLLEPSSSAGVPVWSTAIWFLCHKCTEVAVLHSFGHWGGRPCGCYAGDHYIDEISTKFLSKSWGIAHEKTRWKP